MKPLLNTSHTYDQNLKKAPWKNVFGLQKVSKKSTNCGYDGACTVIAKKQDLNVSPVLAKNCKI